MIQLLAENIPLHDYVTDYDISVTPIESENNFKSVTGQKISKIMGYETVISCVLTKVPNAVAESISGIAKAESFALTYTSPISITENFRCTKYSAVPKCSDPRQKNPLITNNITWNISMTFISVNSGNSGGASADGL